MILDRVTAQWVAVLQCGVNFVGAIIVLVQNQPLSAPEVAVIAAVEAFGVSVIALIAKSEPASLRGLLGR